MKGLEKLLVVVLILSVLIALGVSQKNIRDRRINFSSVDRIFLLPRKEVLQVMALGHDKTVADLLWVRAIQFFGGNFSTINREGFEFKREGINKLFYMIQYLDPDFYQNYQFGAFVFSEGMEDYDQAIRLLELGSEVFPNDWRLLFDGAFTALYYKDDLDWALVLAERAAKRPDAPEHVKRFAGQILSRQGRFQVAMEYFQKLYEESESEVQQKLALSNIYRIRREWDIVNLNEAAKVYEQRYEKPIETLDDLVVAGILPQLPVDPQDGGPYYCIPTTKEIVNYNLSLYRQQEVQGFLQGQVEKFNEQAGRYPDSLEEMMPEETLEKLLDPLGGKFVLDESTRQVVVIPAEMLN